MWQQIALICCSPSQRRQKPKRNTAPPPSKGPLPCDDSDGVSSLPTALRSARHSRREAQRWIDKGNATDNPKKKNYFKHKYFKCVGYE